jgi:hypothetical protein
MVVMFLGSSLAVASFVSLTSPSPMIVSRAAKYHLRLVALGLLFFTGEDLASAIIARARSWGHRPFAGSAAVFGTFVHSTLASLILTADSIDKFQIDCYSMLWLMTALQAALTAPFLSKWVVIPRMGFYLMSCLTLPFVACRTRSMSQEAQRLVLSDFRISV